MPVTVSCEGDIPVPNTALVAVIANCGVTASVTFISDVTTPGTCINRFSVRRTYQASNTCGGIATCSQVITVNDVTLPSVTCPANISASCASAAPPVDVLGLLNTVSDNCGITGTSATFIGDVRTDGSCVNRFSIVRTYRVSDACGNSLDCVQNIIINDVTPPSVTCPANVSASCASAAPPVDVLGLLNTVSDNCGDTGTSASFIGDVRTNGSCVNRFSIVRTYRVSDRCGNSVDCVQNIIINDVTPPSVTCPANVSASCASAAPPVDALGIIGTVSDNCGNTGTSVAFIGDVRTDGGCVNRFSIVRTYRVSDICGNSVDCVQNIIINDVTPPSVTCPANVSASCASAAPPVDALGIIGTVSDNCGNTGTSVAFLGDVRTDGGCVNRFSIVRTYRVSDICGNSVDCVQNIVINDQTPPSITCPAAVSVSCDNMVPAPAPGTLTDADNCGSVVVTHVGDVISNRTCFNRYVATRTYRATDACGQTADCTQLITVNDQTPPVFTQSPQNVTVECNGHDNEADFQAWLAAHGNATATDNCGDLTWTNNSAIAPRYLGCCGIFDVPVRFTVTDLCGQSATQTATFSIRDTRPPQFTRAPQNVTVDCEGSEALRLEWLETAGNAQIFDPCTPSPEIRHRLLQEQKGCGRSGSARYEFFVTDNCGNTAYAEATFTTTDRIPPVIVHCPAGSEVLCTTDIPGPDPSKVYAIDNCGNYTTTLKNTIIDGKGCPVCPATVQYVYSVKDPCGNESICVQTFVASDSKAPVIACQDTVKVACVGDLPDSTSAMAFIRGKVTECGTNFKVIIVGDSGAASGSQKSRTYTFMVEDACGKQSAGCTTTFTATGNCRPLCSAAQSSWGNQDAMIGSQLCENMIGQYLQQNGSIKLGKEGRSLTLTTTACVQALLPGTGMCAPLPSGDLLANNNCDLPTDWLNADGTLRNALAANVITTKLNIWYNRMYNQRDLSIQSLRRLPGCLIDPSVVKRLDNPTVQGLLELSDEYLGNKSLYPPSFGDKLNTALAGINRYWEHCTSNNPCRGAVIGADSRGVDLLPSVTLFPNPTNDRVTILFDAPIAADEVQIAVTGLDGKTISFRQEAAKGNNQVDLSLGSMAPGVYWITVNTGVVTEQLRVVKID